MPVTIRRTRVCTSCHRRARPMAPQDNGSVTAGSATSRPAATPPPSTSGSATSTASSISPAPAPIGAAGPGRSRMRRTRPSAPSTASAAAPPQGRFPQLAGRDDLWRLLVVITVRKVLGQLERQGRRSGRRPAGRRVGPDRRRRGRRRRPRPARRGRAEPRAGGAGGRRVPPAARRPEDRRVCARCWTCGWRGTRGRRSPNDWGAPSGR